MKSSLLALLVTAACLLSAPAIAGGKQCAHAREITDLAGLVLDDLKVANPTISKRFGADAAYLALHYGNLAEPDVDRVLQSLLAHDVAAGRNFVEAYYISRYGYEAAMAKLRATGQPAEGGLLDFTLIRQLAKAGRFDVVARAKDSPPDSNVPLGYALAVIDFPDAEKRSFAQAAEAAGLYAVAGGIYASMGDRSDWPGYIKRNFKKPGFPRLRNTFLVFSAYHPELPPLPDPRAGRNSLMIRKYARTTIAAGFRLPQTSLPFLYGGKIRFEPIFPAKSSEVLVGLVEQGALKPSDNMDKSWLIAFRDIAVRSGDAHATMKKMERIGFYGRRHLTTNAGDILNWMLAVEAITPWLGNPDGEFPAVPEDAGDSLRVNWPTWRSVAVLIKAADAPDLSALRGNEAAMAAELLFAKRDYRQLANLITSLPSPQPGLRLAADFAARLDRLCDSRLYFPGEGVLEPAALYYDFDQVAK
ncbi:MAG: hypothetical protein JWL86_4229 [Rhizobium sp.]|nr:hypothetical protein [Rhizobium sp.]